MVFIYENWSMICWLTKKHPETVLWFVTKGCIVVLDHMLILSVLVEPLEISCAEAPVSLVPQARDLKPEDLLSSLHLMFIFKKLNLF